MDDKTCDLLNEVDDLFTKGTVNAVKFNKFTKCHSYCPHQNKCTNDYERINALGSYLFNEIMKIDKAFKWPDDAKRHIEVFMIWLGDKLFKIENDYKSTLEEFYKKNLEKIMGNVNYWEPISKKLYKDATIKKMSEFYNLLNYICKLIIEHNTNPKKPDSKRLGSHSTRCINFYRAIHISANECGPYLKLLDSLKMIYEIFRMQKIVNNYSINGKEKDLIIRRVKNLTTLKEENRYLLTVNATPSFDDKECIEAKSKDEKIGEQIISKSLQNTPNGTGLTKKPYTGPQRKSPLPAPAKPPVPKLPERPPEKPAPAQTAGVKSPQQLQISSQKKEQSSPTTIVQQPPSAVPPSKSDLSLQTSQKPEASHQNGTNDSDRNKRSKDGGSNVLGGGISQTGSSERKPKDGAQKKQNQGDNSSPSSKAGSQGSSGSEIKDSRSPVPATDGAGTSQSPDTIPPPQPESGSSGPGRSGGESKDKTQMKINQVGDSSSMSQIPGSENQGTKQGVSSDGIGTLKNPVDGIGNAANGSKSDPSTDVKNQPQDPNSKQRVPGGTGSGSSGASGGTGGTGNNKGDSGGGGISGSGNEPGSGANGLGDQSKSSGGSSDPALSTPGESFDFGSSFLKFLLNGTEHFNKASKFVKESQQILEDAKDKINGAYNSAVDNLKGAYNASSSYFSEFINNVTNQLNQADPPPKLGGNQPGSGNPSGGGNSHNPLQSPSAIDPTNPPKDPSQDPVPTAPPTTSIDPKLQKQPSPQSQPIIPHPTQADPFSHKTPGKAIAQLVKSLSSNPNLKKTWNIFPTTWNGSGDCKPEIKLMNATLVCCTSEQCSLTGILITIVLIPIILSIAYKYLSFGSSKKSEKKNMKRVINFHDGNRKTKIIISSNDRNKDLKPVINLVNGKKGPLLNIYKLIRADPMPFINLFFLLIFFVYKRKRNTIE
ncbi:PIR protein CIR protein [Plasmodium vinckei brucechwatti]|uniref:PIR protein CIR protein n=1 Tax=Plasmodium vinckei brucechwatti TaxID=119398 RepID=A0A6V7SG54_PLAVN|nr:PIR protein CIR protein [Plasmodium vinckei brucechwatti]